jgi:adenylate cyclase class 2
MREIEIKARVPNKTLLLAAIKVAGVTLSQPIKQHDVVYGQTGVTDNQPGSIWLRIRTEDDTVTIFTLKQQHTGGLDSIEHETSVSDPDELAAIIATLGFTLHSDLIKTRQKAYYNNIEICLDDVENLGVFIEAEKLTDKDADGATVRKDLWAELQKLGVDKSNEVFEGYDVLLNRKLAQSK